MMQNHLADQFLAVAAEKKEAPLFFDKRDGRWQAISYREVADRVCALAASLATLGLQPADRVILCAENSSSWAICDLAIMAAGGIVVPAYTTHTPRDHAYQLDDSGASFIICSSGRIGAGLIEVAKDRTGIKAAIIIPGAGQKTSILEKADTAFPIHKIEDLWAASPKDNAVSIEGGGTQTCCIIYTSGTGGQPKGVMLSHASIQANIDAARELLEEGEAEKDAVFRSLLPLSHSYEHTAGLHLPVQMGAQVYYCEGSDKISANLAEVRPTLMTAVPRLYEVLHERITKGVTAKGGVSAKAFYKAVELGSKKWQGAPLGFGERIMDKLLDKIVRRKVAGRFGGRLKYFVSGGAALNPEIGQFFLGLGVNILQGYGQTEASPLISANRPGDIRIETVGPPVSGVEVKLSPEGELLARGACIMKGYWQNLEATKQALQDGWLYTGDIAEISEDGFITITGRKKDMIVNSGGDNIAPGRVEAEFLVQPEIAQIMVAGDKRPWLAAVIVPAAELRSRPEEQMTAILKNAVAKANAQLAGFEKVRKFIVAIEDFTIENNQMTPTLKVKRHIVTGAYHDQLDALYR
jgi:long-chain acyl-CoA synthetase